MRFKWGVLIGVIIIVMVVLLGTGFYYTGGVGLVRLYSNYLSKDIADKKFGWQDFTDRGATEKLSGYYAGRIGDKIYIWTLSGLKSFGHRPFYSVYYYMDVCGIIRQQSQAREQNPGGSNAVGAGARTYDNELYFDPMTFGYKARRGDYVAVVRAAEDPGIVSQLYGSSNQYFPLTELRDELCEE